MNRIITASAWAVTLGVVAVLLGWNDLFHLTCGGALLAALLAVVFLTRRRHVENAEPPGEPEVVAITPLRDGAFGVLWGFASTLYLALGFWVLQQVPGVIELFDDRDRTGFTEQVRILEEHGNHVAVAGLVEGRLRSKTTPRWEKELAAAWYRNLIQAGKKCSDPQEAIGFFTKAVTVAGDYAHQGLTDELAQAGLVERQRLIRFADLIVRRRAKGEWAEVVTLLRTALAEPPAGQGPYPLADWLYDGLVRWAHSTTALEEKVARLQEAVQAAEGYGLNGSVALAALSASEKELTERDRFTAQVGELQRQGHWPQLVQLLRQAMEARPCGEWRHPLDRWLADALVRQGDSCDELVLKSRHFQDAIQVATHYRLDQETPALRLRHTEGEIARQREAAQQEKARQRAQEQADLSQRREHEQLARDLEQQFYRRLIRSADHLPEREQKRALYLTALRFGQEQRLEFTDANERLQKLAAETEQERRLAAEQARPAMLPKGCRVGFVTVVTEFAPLVILDVWADHADGSSLRHLQPKDFQITVGGKPVSLLAAVAAHADAPPLQIVLGIDISGSVRGEALRQAQQGGRALLQCLKDRAWVRVISFNQQVHAVCDWTQDVSRAASHLDRLAAGGETALHQTVLFALKDLRGRKGPLSIVLFTDGKDTVGGPPLDKLIQQCKDQGVRVYAIGLRTKDLDADALRRLARATGGGYTEAGAEHEIVDRFQATAQQLRRSFYRLVVLPATPATSANLPIDVTVGGESGVTISSRIPGT